MYGFKMHILLFVGMFYRQSATEDLDVVQEWKGDIRSEVGHSPVLLRFSGSHDPSNLIWHPTYCQSGNNQSCEQRGRERENM
uniref:Secreted protein n=1 Tax=Chrysemys picta bellii TaxID=8478 RepID=A0A8C3FVV9_CHRPI